MGNVLEDVVENKARWVRVSVEMLEHHALQGEPYCERSAWVWLIANAAWKPRRARHHGKMIDIGRGQLLGGREFLAKTWGWGEKKVRLFLDRIERDGMIERGQSKGRNAIIITICNYDKYQKPEKSDGQSKGRLGAGSGPVEGQTLTKGTSYTNTADDTREAKIDLDQLYDKLVEAANGSLNPIAAKVGMMAVSDPIGWINAGADIDLDILPAVRELGHKAAKGSVQSWRYFANRVAELKASRERGLPVVTVTDEPRRESGMAVLERMIAGGARQ